jgi:hypothetical protein
MEEMRPRAGENIEDIWDDHMHDFQSGYFRVALGDGTAFNIGMVWVYDGEDRRLFVGVEGHGAYTFSKGVHYSYLMEKLKLFEWDAMNLADFLNRQLGRTGPAQGKYMKVCLKA